MTHITESRPVWGGGGQIGESFSMSSLGIGGGGLSVGVGSVATPSLPTSAGSGAPPASVEDEETCRNNPANWYFDKTGMDNTPSRLAGIDAEKELSYRQQAACFIQEMGQKLKVNQLCNNTAIVYMNRFYMFHSFQHFHRNTISIAAIFLAAKVEEQPRKLDHVVRVAHYIQFRNEPMIDPKSEAYLNMCHELVMNENVLLQTLGFDLAVDHPHTHIIKCCQLVRASKDLGQVSYLLATNILHLTTMCVQYRPTLVATLAIHVACKWSGWQIPRSKEGKDWWKYVDDQCTYLELEDLTQEYLDIYNKAPPRLKLKVASFSSMKGAPGTSQGGMPPLPPLDSLGNVSSSSSGPPLQLSALSNNLGRGNSSSGGNPIKRSRSRSPSPKRQRVTKPGETHVGHGGASSSVGGMHGSKPVYPLSIPLPGGQQHPHHGIKPPGHMGHSGGPLPIKGGHGSSQTQSVPPSSSKPPHVSHPPPSGKHTTGQQHNSHAPPPLPGQQQRKPLPGQPPLPPSPYFPGSTSRSSNSNAHLSLSSSGNKQQSSHGTSSGHHSVPGYHQPPQHHNVHNSETVIPPLIPPLGGDHSIISKAASSHQQHPRSSSSHAHHGQPHLSSSNRNSSGSNNKSGGSSLHPSSSSSYPPLPSSKSSSGPPLPSKEPTSHSIKQEATHSLPRHHINSQIQAQNQSSSSAVNPTPNLTMNMGIGIPTPSLQAYNRSTKPPPPLTKDQSTIPQTNNFPYKSSSSSSSRSYPPPPPAVAIKQEPSPMFGGGIVPGTPNLDHSFSSSSVSGNSTNSVVTVKQEPHELDSNNHVSHGLPPAGPGVKVKKEKEEKHKKKKKEKHKDKDKERHRDEKKHKKDKHKDKDSGSGGGSSSSKKKDKKHHHSSKDKDNNSTNSSSSNSKVSVSVVHHSHVVDLPQDLLTPPSSGEFSTDNNPPRDNIKIRLSIKKPDGHGSSSNINKKNSNLRS